LGLNEPGRARLSDHSLSDVAVRRCEWLDESDSTSILGMSGYESQMVVADEPSRAKWKWKWKCSCLPATVAREIQPCSYSRLSQNMV